MNSKDEAARKRLYELEDIAEIAVERVNDQLARMARADGDRDFTGLLLTIERMSTHDYVTALPTPHEARVLREATNDTDLTQASVEDLAAEMVMVQRDVEALADKYNTIAEEIAKRVSLDKRAHMVTYLTDRKMLRR